MTARPRRPVAQREAWVVVPARDEALHIDGALTAIAAAAAAAAARGAVHLVVVDDRSTDETASIVDRSVDRWPYGAARRIVGPAMGSGPARITGLELALASASDADALIATTDADSRVPAGWLVAMRELIAEGAQVIAGDVELELNTHPELAAARATRLRARLEHLRERDPVAPHPHFAGANLGFTAAALRALTPLPAPAALEDDALLARCEALGVPVTRRLGFAVRTSSRTTGRAAAGLATALASDAAALGLA